MMTSFLPICLWILLQVHSSSQRCVTPQGRLAAAAGNNIGWWNIKKPLRRSLDSKNCTELNNGGLNKGLYFSPTAFDLGAKIQVAGLVLEEVENSTATEGNNKTCDISSHPFHTCNSQSTIEKRACFSSQNDTLNYAHQHFGSTSMQIWKQGESDTSVDRDRMYSVTVVSSMLIEECDGKPLACHQVRGATGCQIFVCHSIAHTQAYEIVINSDEIGNRTMVGICHLKTDDFDGNHVAFKVLNKKPGDPICHFVFHGGFILCPGEEFEEKK